MTLNIGVHHAKVVEELPARPKRRGGSTGRAPAQHLVDLASLVRESEGQWVFCGTAEKRIQAQALAFRIRKGKSAAFKPAGAYDAECRQVVPGEEETEVYARYLGEVPVELENVNDEVDEESVEDDEWEDDDEG